MDVLKRGFAEAPIGRLQHSAHELRERHCHDEAFVAVVLSGGYQEAGDEGRWDVGPGDVLIHHAFESHLDRFASSGAEVVILPVPVAFSHGTAVRGRVADADLLVRTAERDPVEAAISLAEQFAPLSSTPLDWPDALAAALRTRPPFALRDWAHDAGLRPETISRGFRAAYGCSPKVYRASARARAACVAVSSGNLPFAEIAHQLEFADQSHMTRAVTALTGWPPGVWRRQSTEFKTAVGAAA